MTTGELRALFEFLTARYDERANEVAEKHQCSEVGNMCGGYNCECGEPFLLDGCPESRHLLADLASKRAILEWCRKSQWVADQGYQSGYSQGELDAYVTVLRELARPFAGRPDYDPAWATG